MGRQLAQKMLAKQEKENAIVLALVNNSKKYKMSVEEFDFSALLPDKDNIFRDPELFTFKGKSKDKRKQFLQFVHFVYEKYSTSKIFDYYWLKLLDKNNASPETLEYLSWYINIATGGSFYKNIAKSFLTKREAHIFLNAPTHFKINEAIFYSIAIAEGASLSTATMIARSKLTDYNYEIEFWRNCARFFSIYKPTDLLLLNDVIDYIYSKYIENNNFSLFGSGYTFESLVKHTKRWHADLGRMRVIGNSKWDGNTVISDEMFVTEEFNDKIYWSFKQIKTAKDLAKEGNAMRHCVYGYLDRCQTGAVSIWSLSRGTDPDLLYNFKKKVTIELRNDNTIVQARRKANISPNPEEHYVIGKWAEKNRLRINTRY